MRPLLVLALVLLAAAACTNSGSSSGDPPGTPDDPDVTPTPEEERPSFRLEFYNTTGSAEWERVDAAAAYRVGGHVIWWPDCSLTATVEPVTVDIDEKLPPETLDYILPRPEDEAYTRIKEFSLLVTAVNEADEVIAYQNTGQSNERICP